MDEDEASQKPVQLWQKLQEESRAHEQALERERQLQVKLSTLIRQRSQNKLLQEEQPRIIAELRSSLEKYENRAKLDAKDLAENIQKSSDLSHQVQELQNTLKILQQDANEELRQVNDENSKKLFMEQEKIQESTQELERKSQQLKQLEVLLQEKDERIEDSEIRTELILEKNVSLEKALAKEKRSLEELQDEHEMIIHDLKSELKQQSDEISRLQVKSEKEQNNFTLILSDKESQVVDKENLIRGYLLNQKLLEDEAMFERKRLKEHEEDVKSLEEMLRKSNVQIESQRVQLELLEESLEEKCKHEIEQGDKLKVVEDKFEFSIIQAADKERQIITLTEERKEMEDRLQIVEKALEEKESLLVDNVMRIRELEDELEVKSQRVLALEETGAEMNKRLDQQTVELTNGEALKQIADVKESILQTKTAELQEMERFLDEQILLKSAATQQVEHLRHQLERLTEEKVALETTIKKQSEIIQKLHQDNLELHQDFKQEKQDISEWHQREIEEQLQQLETLQQNQLELLHRQMDKQRALLVEQEVKLQQYEQQMIKAKKSYWGTKK